MHMQVRRVDLLLRPLKRRLMNSRTIRKARLEEIIIAARDLCNCLCKVEFLGVVQVDEGALVGLGENERLEGPDSPPWADNEKGGVLKDYALLFFHLELGVVGKEVVSGVVAAVLLELCEFQSGLFWRACRGPDLAVRMGVGAAHGGTFVLEDLHPAVLRARCGDTIVGVGSCGCCELG